MKKRLLKRTSTLILTFVLLMTTFQFTAQLPAAAAEASSLLITEMCINATNVSDNSDGFEFIELKNAGSSSVNILNYHIKMYHEDDNPVTDTTATTYHDFTLPSKSVATGAVMVIWIQTTDTTDKTLAAFNTHYGTSLTSSQIVLLDVGTGGLSNTGYSRIVLTNASSVPVIYAKYNEDDNSNDTAEQGKSIHYEFRENPIPTYKAMYKIAANQPCTPGSITTKPTIEITEIVANSSDDELYEYVELHNTTGSSISLPSYKMRYWSNDSTSYDWDFPSSPSFSIPAGGYITVWIYHSACAGLTLSNFNAHYHTNFTSSKVYTLTATTTHFANTSKRAVEILTDGGTQISKVIWNELADGDAATDGTSILYESPIVNTKIMRKSAANQEPSPCSPYQLLSGQIHSHTAVSDGLGTPDGAYTAAAGQSADYYALTDHSHDITSGEWTTLLTEAADHSVANDFTAFNGYEMTWAASSGWWGHMNTFNTSWYNNRSNDYTTKGNMHSHIDMLSANPESISQFNHPVENWGTFGDYDYYSQQADGVIPLAEVSQHGITQPNFPYSTDDYTYIANGYFRALEQGWHVAPSCNSDDHSASWYVNQDDNNSETITDQVRTVILAPRSTRDELFDAIRNRRVYAAFEDDLQVRFSTTTGALMGDRIAWQDNIAFNIDAYDPDAGDNISKISILSSYGQVVWSTTNASTERHVTATLSSGFLDQFPYYVALIEEADGGWAITAPIWIEEDAGYTVSLDCVSSGAATTPCDIRATVHNTSSTTATTSVSVVFFDGAVDSDNMIESVGLGAIAASGTASATMTNDWWQSGDGSDFISICVIANNRVTTKRLQIPKLLITEVVANSGGTGDAYEYIELYNNTKSAINLSSYELGLSGNCGDANGAIYAFDDHGAFSIPAKSTALIWTKNDMTLTIDDFKSFYGITSYPSSRIYEFTDTNLANTPTRILTILNHFTDPYDNSKTVDARICRAWYNDGMDLNLDADTGAGESIVYVYPKDGTVNMTKTGTSTTTFTPGTVTSGQVVQ